jgi:hypothetical protein
VLATPLLAMIVVVVQLVYLQDILGDNGDGLVNDGLIEVGSEN